MKINWKLRLKNRVTLTAIIMAVIGLVYQVLGLCGIVPSISQDKIIETASMLINIFALLGIIIDPTTEGADDSELAMGYDEPSKKTTVRDIEQKLP